MIALTSLSLLPTASRLCFEPEVVGDPVPVKLYVVRHGETEWSLSGQHTGSIDIPLTGHGEEEARRLAPHLSGIRFSAALCSPRQRAKTLYVPLISAGKLPRPIDWRVTGEQGKPIAARAKNGHSNAT